MNEPKDLGVHTPPAILLEDEHRRAVTERIRLLAEALTKGNWPSLDSRLGMATELSALVAYKNSWSPDGPKWPIPRGPL